MTVSMRQVEVQRIPPREARELHRERGITVISFDGGSVEPKHYTIDWDDAAAEKGGYDWFMLKEIEEQTRRNMEMFQNAMRMFTPFPPNGGREAEPEENGFIVFDGARASEFPVM